LKRRWGLMGDTEFGIGMESRWSKEEKLPHLVPWAAYLSFERCKLARVKGETKKGW